MKKITIFQYNLSAMGGAEKNCVVLCNELVREGYSVELVLLYTKTDNLINHLDDKVKIRVLGVRKVWLSLPRILRYLYLNRTSTIITFDTLLSILVSFSIKILSLNVKLIIRNTNTISYEIKEEGNLLKTRLLFFLVKHSYNNAFAVVAQSFQMKDDLVKKFSIVKKKIRVINNPSFIFESGTLINNKHENNFLFIGRIAKQKGLDFLIDAFFEAQRQYSNMNLTILGDSKDDGKEKQRILTLVDELKIQNKVHFLGFRENIDSYIKTSKAVVLTSLYEGFPNSLVESISLGVPVIAFDCKSGPSEIINENNGILVKYLDTHEFSRSMLKIAKNEVVFDKREIKESAKKFNIKYIIDCYIQIIEK